MVVALCTGCSHSGNSQTAPPTGTQRSTSTASTAAPVTLTRPNAKLTASIAQLRGGVPGSKRPAILKAAVAPVKAWYAGAFLQVAYPTDSFPKAFDSWTQGAARLATRDKDTTTNAVLGSQLVALVADRQSVTLDVFATRGVTGGATAYVRLVMTGERTDGSLVRYAISGQLHLTRGIGAHAGDWRIFGYQLQRTAA